MYTYVYVQTADSKAIAAAISIVYNSYGTQNLLDEWAIHRDFKSSVG